MYKEENKILGSAINPPANIRPWNVMPTVPPVMPVVPPVMPNPIMPIAPPVVPNPIMPIVPPVVPNPPMQTLPILENPNQVMANQVMPQVMPEVMPKVMPNNMMANQAVFPEIFYKMQPYIMMVCDQIEGLGNVMPTQEMVEGITDNIYEDMSKMYPDLVEYANEKAVETVVSPYDFMRDRDRDRDRDHDRGRRPFRRRGMFRDIIDILLLSELFGRRRRRF